MEWGLGVEGEKGRRRIEFSLAAGRNCRGGFAAQEHMFDIPNDIRGNFITQQRSE